MKLEQSDRRFLGRGERAEDIEVKRTAGTFLYDARGRKYVDFLAGWCVGNFGWDNLKIRPRKRRVPDYVYPEYLYAPWAELAELLASIAPGKLQKCYRACGGSEAVDIALQMAMVATGRRKFVALKGSYHGNTIGTVSIAAREARESFPSLLSNCATLSPPLDSRAALRLERLLARRDVAAVILEPISCNLAVLIPEMDFMKRLQQLCRRYGTLLVADEVACGFGRTGRIFASEHFGLEPDILCMAKALSGGYAPIGATITTEKVSNKVSGKADFYSTYGWHPASVEMAIASVRWMIRHQKRLFANVAEVGALFERRLRAMQFDGKEADVRICGLAIAVETPSKRYASRVADRCRQNGLLLTTSDNCLTMFPALTLDLRTANQGLDILEKSLR